MLGSTIRGELCGIVQPTFVVYLLSVQVLSALLPRVREWTSDSSERMTVHGCNLGSHFIDMIDCLCRDIGLAT